LQFSYQDLTKESLKQATAEYSDHSFDGCAELPIIGACQFGMVVFEQLQSSMSILLSHWHCFGSNSQTAACLASKSSAPMTALNYIT
jgi:hypothetical protein